MEMTKDQLQEILRKHALWLEDKEGGERANLFKADLSKANLSEANLFKAYLSKADLSRANLSKANLSEADLSKACLGEAYLREANLFKAYLGEAYLSKANLSEANLSEADLSKANLSEANLFKAYLSLANLSRANLSKANLRQANLGKADLSGAAYHKILAIGPIGVHGGYTYALQIGERIKILCGGLWNDVEAWQKRCQEEHGDSAHGQSYTAAYNFIKAYAAAYKWSENND